MSVLKIKQEFFDKLSSEESSKILRIYGYNDAQSFMRRIIMTLNDEYDFLGITSFAFYGAEENGLYHMYNGYIDGQFNDYDLITVSFTTILGKEGNVFLSQQLVPLITSMNEKNLDYLINPRIKKICLLTTHKSNIMTPDKNEIKIDSNIQMAVNFANTLNFEMIEIFPIKNLQLNNRYRTVSEIIEHTNFIQNKNPSNSQFKQVVLNETNNTLTATFETIPVGQEQKFFALKMYAIAIINTKYQIDLTDALQKTSDVTIKRLYEFINYINTAEVREMININNAKEIDDNIVDVDTASDDNFENPIIVYKNGKKTFARRKNLREVIVKNYNYLCDCHEDKHYYFTSSATNKNYLEGHHMIPMENQHQYWEERQINLDIPMNLIPLCPHCHSKIHKATKGEKVQIITEIYNRHERDLKKIDDNITLEKFATFYQVYIY